MNYTYVVCKKDQKSRLLAATEPQAYVLTVWRGNESLTFTGETESLCLKALRVWLNGGDEGADGLTLRDCPAPHDTVLGYDEKTAKWYVKQGGMSWGTKTEGGALLRSGRYTPTAWRLAASERCTDRRYFDEFPEAVKAFLDACSCRVFPLSARCRCADCKRWMTRAFAISVPFVGRVCYDCLTYYVGGPWHLPEPIIEEGEL